MQLLNSTQVPNAFIEGMAQLSGAATKCFLAICRKTIGWHKLSDRISFTQLHELTGLETQAITDAIAELEKIPLVKVERRAGKCNVYDLDFEEGTTLKTEVVPFEKRSATTSKTEVTKDTLKDTLQKTPVLYGFGFDECWELYPRKLNKQGAWKAYRARVKEGVPRSLLLACTKEYMELCHRKGTGEEFILHGATFYGPNHRYMDYKPRPQAPRVYTAPKAPPTMTDAEREEAAGNLSKLQDLLRTGRIRKGVQGAAATN